MRRLVTAFALMLLAAAPAGAWWEPAGLAGERVFSVANYSRDLCFAASSSALYRIYNRGAQVTPVYGYGPPDPALHVCVRMSAWEEDDVFLAWGRGTRSDGLWYSSDQGANWDALNYMLCPNALALDLDGQVLFLGSDTLGGALERSTDWGQSWSECGSGLPTREVRCLYTTDELYPWLVFCGLRERGLYVSADTGLTWTRCGPDSQLDVTGISWLPGGPSYLLVAGCTDSQCGVWCSTDTGASWAFERSVEHPTELAHARLASDGEAGIYWRGGGSWPPDSAGLANRHVHCLSEDGGAAFWYAGTDSGVFHLDVTPGVEEQTRRKAAGGRTKDEPDFPTVLGGPDLARLDCRMLDVQGRDVTDRRKRLAPGVYLLKGEGGRLRDEPGSRTAVRKVIVQP